MNNALRITLITTLASCWGQLNASQMIEMIPLNAQGAPINFTTVQAKRKLTSLVYEYTQLNATINGHQQQYTPESWHTLHTAAHKRIQLMLDFKKMENDTSLPLTPTSKTDLHDILLNMLSHESDLVMIQNALSTSHLTNANIDDFPTEMLDAPQISDTLDIDALLDNFTQEETEHCTT